MEKLGFLTLAVKLVVNVHDMNNEGSIGQTTDIRMIRMVGEDGKELSEAPAVSGRMMKHWHLAYMLREELQLGETAKLCEHCKVWEPERQPSDEKTGVEKCIICDSHGFLSAKKRIVGEDKGKNLRRSSCVSFSWLLPVIGTDTPSKQVIHSRVAHGVTEATQDVVQPASIENSADLPIDEKLDNKTEEEKKKTSQMIFYKSYASSVYGFICSIDLDRIGKAIDGAGAIDSTEIKRRRKIAVKALFPMVMGAFGASQSHALPHTKCLGMLIALSNNTNPLPNLISPIYNNGFDDSIKMLELKDNVKYWGYGEADKGTQKQNLQTIFNSILTEIQ